MRRRLATPRVLVTEVVRGVVIAPLYLYVVFIFKVARKRVPENHPWMAGGKVIPFWQFTQSTNWLVVQISLALWLALIGMRIALPVMWRHVFGAG